MYDAGTMTTHKHLFFDMDHTVTPARQPIEADMLQLLQSLTQDIVIVSGSTVVQMNTQITDLPKYQLGQNGNEAFDRDGKELWKFSLSEDHKKEIFSHIDKIIALVDHELNEEWNPIEDRGGQITFSPIGNTAPVEKKKTYDPDRKKRELWLEQAPFESEELVVKIGGSTSLDYLHKDKNKGTNVAKLIDLLGWNKDECVYFGDGLYPGGNDEAVIGVIETVAVTNQRETFEYLQRYK